MPLCIKKLFTSIVTSIFTKDEQIEKLEEHDYKVEAHLLMETDNINQFRMYPQIQPINYLLILGYTD